jgi:hypothetical protein
MKKYARIQKFDEDGDLTNEFFELLTIEHLSIALEDELIDTAEQGESMVITVVEMEEEEYKAIAEANGY